MAVYDAHDHLMGSGSVACKDLGREEVVLSNNAGKIIVDEIRFEELVVWSSRCPVVCNVDKQVFEIDKPNNKFSLPLGTNLVIGGKLSWATPLSQLRNFRSYTLEHENALITICLRRKFKSCVALNSLRVNLRIDHQSKLLVAVASVIAVDDFETFVPPPAEFPKASYVDDNWDSTSPKWERRPTLPVAASSFDEVQVFCWDDDDVEFAIDPMKSAAMIEFYDDEHSRVAYGLLRLPHHAGKLDFPLAGDAGYGTVNVEFKDADAHSTSEINPDEKLASPGDADNNQESCCELASCRKRVKSLAEEVTIKQVGFLFPLGLSNLRAPQNEIDRLTVQVEEQRNALRRRKADIANLEKAIKELKHVHPSLSLDIEAARDHHPEENGNFAKAVKKRGRGGDDAKTLRELSGMCEKLRRENKILLEAAKRREEESCKIALLRHSHHELQKAHMAQAAHILKFQSERSEIDRYKKTISTQESIIKRLERVVEEKIREICKQRTSETEAAKEEIAKVKAEEALAIDSLTAELRQHELKAEELQRRDAEHAKEARAKEDEERRRDAIVARETANSAFALESNLEKVKALEERLVSNATESGREVARLNLRIFELETLASNRQNSEQAPDVYIPAYW